MATKKEEIKRTRMTDEEVKKFLVTYKKDHDLDTKEFEAAVHRCAAARWAALERNAKKAEAKAKKPKAKAKAKAKAKK